MEGAQSIPPLASFEAVQKVAKADTGTSITDLAKVSHIHLFGISIIFLLTGAIFALSYSSGLDSRMSRCDSLPDYSDGYRLLVVHQISRSRILLLRRCRGWSVHRFGARLPILIALWEMWIEPLKIAALSVRRSRAVTPLAFRPKYLNRTSAK